MSWFRKLLPPKIKRAEATEKKTVPEGLWSKCPSCEAVLYFTDLENNLQVCPKCNFHNRLSARQRLDFFLDPEGRAELASEVVPLDPLKFKDSRKYIDRLVEAEKETGETDALVVMQGSVKNVPVVAAAFEFGFLGGSMGSVVGERFVRAVQASCDEEMPFICFTATGGARMQEGLLSLMQMAKATAALQELTAKRQPFISVLTDPTMGGVSASFAFIGDVVIAEPGALIGFAGPRVIQDTIGEELPPGFQRSDFVLEHGMVDAVVHRKDMHATAGRLLGLFYQSTGGFKPAPQDSVYRP